ncbi:MAG: ABC transporter permease [Blastocatellia bacterium]|nr:ABC transporter permease [Blastocatellia bacterium]
MKNLIQKITGMRLWALFVKELRQIQRDRQMVVALIVPPTIQLILLGFALNPEVTNLRLGVVDENRTAVSRELISAFVEGQAFQVAAYYQSPTELGRALSSGNLDAGLVIPSDFAKRFEARQPSTVQLAFDGVDSNRAGIASSYAQRTMMAFNQRNGLAPVKMESPVIKPNLTARVALLFNPGLRSSWFMLAGVLGILLVLNGSLVAAGALVKEKEAGTIEQLLMTPAGATEIIVAKITPVFLLLSCDVWLALLIMRLVFDMPMRGSLLVLFCAGALCVFAGIGLGTFLATFSKSQQQAQLLNFFVNPPIALLSGATSPLEGMPHWVQPLTIINPVRHFATIARGVLLKGAGLDIIYPNLLALFAFAVVLVGLSAWQFRKQLE